MKNLIRILLKYYSIWLFLMLEGIAFFFIFQQNHYHNAIFLNSSAGVVGFFNKQSNHINDYFNLKKDNQRLHLENQRLRQLLEQKKSLNPDYYYQIITAEVVSNSVYRQKNYLSLNKGELQGVKKQMAVVGPEGIVGFIENTGRHYSSVIPVINTNFHISAEIQKNHYYGSLSWDGKNPRIAQLTEIPNYVNVQKGDTIITSGYSKSFPKGELIGKVLTATKTSANPFWTIQVELFTDFKGLNKIYIISNPLIQELNTLEKTHD
jgi:rod shape-determining protein MreC